MPRVNESDEVFKKAEQVVGRPKTTDKNINEEEMLHHPPDTNKDPIMNLHRVKYPKKKEKVEDLDGPPSRMGEPRLTSTEQLANMSQNDAIVPER
ncbi:hypothetical protein GALMADRAFT_1216798 [Galerina marginata CBS 339.88]|uniref:Uncharacterized protein n=1 Tax=Galerina marginata (strain CBS 339.88) TaxID=685588 RepID=A0A067S7H2_GALM3|nr:hypothetical protein GALMADRAFT_1216798 [Galerina marginata CBS 339.88]